MSGGLRGVVAGVSTPDSRSLVRWAAGEASVRGVGLRLVTAAPPGTARACPATERVLADLADGVLAEWPDLVVATDLTTGPPAAVLRGAAEGAYLLVVGADGASPFMEAISGSVPGELLTTTSCPLAVVPRREWTTPASAPVVVGLDDPAVADAALAYAFAAASRAGQPLVVMHCPSAGADVTEWVAALHGFGELFPNVEATVEEGAGEPQVRLVTASRRATALVLGARGGDRRASGLFGSMSRNLIRRSRCPVVIARGPSRVLPSPVRAAS